MSSYKYNSIKILVFVAVFLLSAGAAFAAPAQPVAKRNSLPTQDATLYATNPQPLTIAQCGQCHPNRFADLKQSGGKHQFDCRECHEVFHAYNPLKNNYAEIMPKCATCHNPPHGAKHVDCLNCHQNPHTPRRVPMTRMLAGICSDCHKTQASELKQFPSKHTKQACSSCHYERHGYIPSCSECHEPHFAGQDQATCLQCHPVHQPLSIQLSTDVDLRTCNACHPQVYSKWKGTRSKHGKVSCARCHTKHGLVPKCTDCHVPPKSHSKKLLEMFPKCLTCHLDVHDLPVKKDRK
ncbi:MAG: cytochrome C [Deltaproteobacteria bacterium]|nr:cytochrome C [Deltaproteobacteria bacterium]